MYPLKPIFHCNMKLLALVLHVGYGPQCTAYIPPERKIPGVRGWRWAMHTTPEFWVTQRKIYQNVGIFCVSWRQFFALPDAKPPTPTLKFALAPTPTPDASQWNIGGVGSQRKILALSMNISFFCVDFILVG